MTGERPSYRAVGDSWFERPAPEVARDLLGALLRTDRPRGQVVLRITEVEAYTGADDPASHAFRGRSARNASMYLSGGHLYVYRHLGLHDCVNVVAGPRGTAGAVLLRAGEVVEGLDLARQRRVAAGVVRRDVDLARGPARLAVALGLDAADDGRPLAVRFDDGPAHAAPGGSSTPGRSGVTSATTDDLVLTLAPLRLAAASGPRVGVSARARDPEHHAWRFWLPGEPTVSVDRGAVRPRRTGRWEEVTMRARRTAH